MNVVSKLSCAFLENTSVVPKYVIDNLAIHELMVYVIFGFWEIANFKSLTLTSQVSLPNHIK
jgi:hypothetical protein